MTHAPQQCREVLACRREFPERSYERCGKPAKYIVWGKLFPKEALGPRCRDCLEDQCGHRGPTDPIYAIYDLPDFDIIRKQAQEEERERTREALATVRGHLEGYADAVVRFWSTPDFQRCSLVAALREDAEKLAAFDSEADRA